MNTGDPIHAATLSTDEDSRLLLRLLASIEADSAVTQRSIARELGIALGLAGAGGPCGASPGAAGFTRWCVGGGAGRS